MAFCACLVASVLDAVMLCAARGLIDAVQIVSIRSAAKRSERKADRREKRSERLTAFKAAERFGIRGDARLYFVLQLLFQLDLFHRFSHSNDLRAFLPEKSCRN